MKNLLILLAILLLAGCSQAPNTQTQQDNAPISGINNLSGKQYSSMASKINTFSTGSDTNLTGSKTQDETQDETPKSAIKEINKPEIGLAIKLDPSLGELEDMGAKRRQHIDNNKRKSRNISYGINRYRCNDKDTGGHYTKTPYNIIINNQKIYYSDSNPIPGDDDEGDRMTTLCFERNGKTHIISIMSKPEYHKTLRKRLLENTSFDNKINLSTKVVGYAEFNKKDNSGYDCISQEDEDDCINKSKQKDNKYIMFHIISSSDSRILDFIKESKGNLFVGDRSIGLGCIDERDNGKIIVNDDDKIPHEIAIKILNSTKSNPISLKVIKKDTPNKTHSVNECYSFIFIEE